MHVNIISHNRFEVIKNATPKSGGPKSDRASNRSEGLPPSGRLLALSPEGWLGYSLTEKVEVLFG